MSGPDPLDVAIQRIFITLKLATKLVPRGKDLMVCSKLQLGFQFQDVLDFTARMKVGCLWILDVLIAMHLYGVSHLFMHLDLDFRLADLD